MPRRLLAVGLVVAATAWVIVDRLRSQQAAALTAATRAVFVEGRPAQIGAAEPPLRTVMAPVDTPAAAPSSPERPLASAQPSPTRRPQRRQDVWVSRMFAQLDRNGDGLLNVDEMPPSLRADLQAWDQNRDGLIDPEEFRQYVESTIRRGLGVIGDGPLSGGGEVSALPEEAAQAAGVPNKPAGAVGRRERVQDRLVGAPGSPGEAAAGAPGARVTAARRIRTVAPLAETNAGGVGGSVRGSLGGGTAAQLGRDTASIPAGSIALNRVTGPRRRALSADQPSPAPRRAGLASAPRAAGSAAASPQSSAATQPQPAASPTASNPGASPYDWLATEPLPLRNPDLPYWAQRDAQNEARAALGPAPVLFLGDSITDLFALGAGKPVWDKFLAPAGALDFAVSGITTSEVLWQVESGQVAAVAPEVAVLMIGTNNLGQGQTPPAVAAGVSRVVREIRLTSPATSILLLGILPRGSSGDDPFRAEIAAVNTQLAALDDGKHVRFLDIGSHFVTRDGSIPDDVMADGLHPTLEGYQILISNLWKPLQEMSYALAPQPQ